MVELSPQMTTFLLVGVGVLLVLLTASFLSRPRVFTQYLKHMAGITLSARDVAQVYKQRGKAGVRDMFIEAIIREDAKDGPRLTPDSIPDTEQLAPEAKE
jgi:hypothetical protein